MPGKPKMLDLYCGEGGAGAGYDRAGWEVTGVDIRPMPRYPFRFIQADALTFPLDGYDAIHASPPCQARSRGTPTTARAGYPSLIGATRARLAGSGVPWIMENVPPIPGAEPMRADLKLCGCIFGLPPELRRERWFETSPTLFDLRAPCWHPVPGSISINRRGGRYNGPGERHNRYIPLAECKRLMGVDWMSQEGLGEAIPPAYTAYLGRLLLDMMSQSRRAG